MKRRHFDLFVLFLWTLINVPTCLSTNNSSVLDEFSELVSAQISVSIDPLNVVYENQTAQGVYCTLSIHRDNCLNPKIRATETISWHTRICFKWTCSNTTTHVMKIESCWTGSSRKPIFLIDKNGTPRYENHLLAAYSVGYLSVRLVGADKIRLSCTVRLCHVCQQQCPLITATAQKMSRFEKHQQLSVYTMEQHR
ncbi:ZP domain-containing protein [Aphelenchoides bicaudatus]|nr:ZP domain-containing protein [Aphelenchoides bicaudatus]